MITVDFRETELLGLINGCKTENLIHGDIIISTIDDFSESDNEEYININKERKQTQVFVIERKTLQDLSSSIKDSRFREQKSRLLSVYPSNKIIYIIESCKTSKHTLPDKTLRSAILNLVLKHKITVLFSKNISDTAEIIKDIDTKVCSGNLEEGLVYGSDNIGFTPIKKSSILEKNKLACQLTTIPGVSTIVANVLQEKFLNMKNLIQNLENKDTLTNIRINEKRKIGPKLSEKIYNSLTQ